MQHDEMNMGMRERKVQGKRGENRIPRVIVHVPEWFNQFAVLSRGLRYVLAGVAVVACAGTIMYISDVLPKSKEASSPYSGTRTGVISAIKTQASSPYSGTRTGVISAIKTGVEKSIPDPFLGPPPIGTPYRLVMSDVADLSLPMKSSDTPFFIHMPRSASCMIMSIMGQCLGLVQSKDAWEHIVTHGDKKYEVRDMEDMGKVVDEKSTKVVEVDTLTPEGIKDAKKYGLLEKGVVNVVTSSNPYSAAALFSSDHRGRMFTILRHPIERIVSSYESYKNMKVDENKKFQNPSLEEYARSPGDKPEFNYLTKLLSNNIDKKSNELTVDDLNMAKELLRRKVLIGLLSEKTESLKRFENFFGWKYSLDTRCKEEKLIGKGINAEKLKSEDPLYEMLAKKNEFDMHLYTYAEQLFKEQGIRFAS